jgi:hypothetical protein
MISIKNFYVLSRINIPFYGRQFTNSTVSETPPKYNIWLWSLFVLGTCFKIRIWIELSRKDESCKFISKRMIISLRHSSILRRIWLNFMAHRLVLIRRHFSFHYFCFRISYFFDLSITDEKWVVEMCIWCIKIVSVWVLHFHHWVDAFAGGVSVFKGLYSPVAKYFGTSFKIRIWIELSSYKFISKRRIISLRHSYIFRRIWFNFLALNLVFIRRHFSIHYIFRSFYFFDLNITKQTWVVEMRIWCIKIVNVLIWHFNPLVEVSAGGLSVSEGLYSPVVKYFGTSFKIRIWIEFNVKKKKKFVNSSQN